MKCLYELCSTTNLAGGARGYCGAHYKQFRLNEPLRPVRGSAEFWAAKLNANGEKQCSQCEYWLPLDEFFERRDGSRVNQRYGRAHCRRCNILRRMSINARQFDEMLADQGGACSICKRMPVEGEKELCVDHDHSCCPAGRSCGRCIRGLLCQTCNDLLGRAYDQVEVLVNAILYLNGACPVR